MAVSTKAEMVENADIDRDTPQPEIHIEERRLKLLDFCKTAYYQMVVSPQNTPHCRCDILDWLPLDP